MQIYQIGTSALRANQTALQVVANNLANADTEGYSRQQVNFAERSPVQSGRFLIGSGVDVASIRRVVDNAVSQAITLNQSLKAQSETQLAALQDVERLLTPSVGGLQESASQLFNSIELLASQPHEQTRQREFLAAAQHLASQVTQFHQQLDHIQNSLSGIIRDTVQDINRRVDQISGLDKQIRFAEMSGRSAPSLLDQREKTVNELAKLVDLNPGGLSSPNGQLVAAGGWLVVGEHNTPLSVISGPGGTVQVSLANSTTPIQPLSGQLAGLLAAQSGMVNSIREEMQDWTKSLLSGINEIQATGISSLGPVAQFHTDLSGVNRTLPLSESGLLFPIQTGELAISMTDQTNGARLTFLIPVNPDVDTLTDIVQRIAALPALRASLSPAGQLMISGTAGTLIDFAGRPDSPPDFSGVTGTTVGEIQGTSNALSNRNLIVTATASGTVGVTPGLKLAIRDAATSELLKEVDVGENYGAGQPIQLLDGLTLTLTPGTLNAGDQFLVKSISQPDTSKFLSATGIAGIFGTSDLKNITVSSDFLDGTRSLALGTSGSVGDVSRARDFFSLRESRVLKNGTETLEESLANQTSAIGIQVRSQQLLVDNFNSQFELLRNQQDSVSGVDPNEELMLMMQYQRAFQASARYLNSVNTVMDDLFSILS